MHSAKKSHRLFWWFVKLQIVLMLLVAAGVAYYYLGGYAETIRDLHADAVAAVSHSSADVFRNNETSVCYDANGNMISTLVGDRDVYYLTYDEIPSKVTGAFVSIEDKKFYRHHGYDIKGILRAAWAAIREQSVTQGGSTITQQLARNIFLNSDRTWERKVEEIFIAVELEKKYSKDEIMEFYVNNVYFANGYYGIGAAAKGYFSCDPDQLSLSQIAFLCAIPNSPTLYDPLTNYDNTIDRRNLILSEMLSDGVISQKDYDKAVAETIVIVQTGRVKNDYAETFTYDCAIRLLMEQDGFVFQNSFANDEAKEAYDNTYSETYTEYQKKLYTEGYRIYTSLDLEMQEELQTALNEELDQVDRETTEDGIYTLQGSAVCIDNRTGYVKAIIGGRNPAETGYSLNRAFQSFRQPGSSIKPLIVYTPAMERGYTPDSILVDEEVKVDPDDKNSSIVHNADGSYAGEITLRRAVAISKNTVAWKLFDELTPEVGLDYLLEMNFSHIDSEDYRLTSALGGLTEGVSALEMTSAFATLENDGKYRDPTCILKITDAEGNIIVETNEEEKEIYKTNAARMMTDVLQSVIKEGTGKGYGLDNMECAAKTGTTNDNKDSWFVGYTHYYTTGIWVGYDTPKEIKGLAKTSYPGLIWKSFMTTIHDGLAPTDFVDYIEYEIPEKTDASGDATEEDSEAEETGAAEGTESAEENAAGENTGEQSINPVTGQPEDAELSGAEQLLTGPAAQ